MASHLKVFIGYNSISIIPLIVSLFLADFPLSNTIAFSAILFGGALISMGKTNNKILLDMFSFQQANIQMVQKVSDTERLSELKDEFLSNMSHEIRTPLNGIIGMIDVLENTLEFEPKEEKYFNVLKSSSQQLLALINAY